MNAENVSVIKLASHQVPSFVELKSSKWVLFGEDNGYPDYLLRLFNRSPKHNAIVTGKVHFIKGRGFVVDEMDDQVLKAKIYDVIKNINNNDSLDDLAYKVISDMELFAGIAIEVVPRRDKKGWAQLNHIDRSKIRVSKDRKKIWYCKKWSEEGNNFYKPKPEDIIEMKVFNPTTFSGVYLFDQYRPGMGDYPLPEYIGAIPYIQIDYEIANFHLNNLKNGFAAGTMISFNNGDPEEGKEEVIEKQIKAKFSGTDNAGQLVLVFSNGKDSAPTIVPLMSNNFDKLFDTLNQTAQQEIFTGHKVTNPLIFGIKDGTALGGGGEELKTSIELFESVYVAPKQRMIEGVFNYLFSLNGLGNPLMILKAEPIAFTLSESGLLQVLTKDEVREMLGQPAGEKPANESIQKTLNALNSLSPLVATKVLETMTENEIRALAELPPSATPINPVAPAAQGLKMAHTEDQVLSVFLEYGEERVNYKFISSQEVENKEDAFIKEIAFYKQTFDKKDELIPSSNPSGTGGVGTGTAISIKVMYSYELRSSAPALVKGGKSRPFCIKMMQLSRLYSREDIDAISTRLGYDVWKMRGGFYHNPKLDVTTDYCRHIWSQNIVSNG